MARKRAASAAKPEPVASSPSHRSRYKANRAAKSERNALRSENRARTALVLGGGAPNMALTAGAVAAFADRGIVFDVVSTSGAGSLAGLLWLAPKGQAPAEPLRSVVTMSISDAIYRMLPVNYKVFQRPGTWADLWRSALAANPFFAVRPRDYEQLAPYALWADWMALWAASLSPSGLTWSSWASMRADAVHRASCRFRQDPTHHAALLSQCLQRHRSSD
jgi:predicted acylesterase/phospholipase RssA